MSRATVLAAVNLIVMASGSVTAQTMPKALVVAGGGGGSFVCLTYDATAVTAMPESATWAMMVVGLGAIGATVQRRRRSATRFA